VPVNVGLASGAAPVTSATLIAPSARGLPAEIRFAKSLALVIGLSLYDNFRCANSGSSVYIS